MCGSLEMIMIKEFLGDFFHATLEMVFIYR